MIKRYGTIIGFILGIVAIFGSYMIEGGSFKALFLVAPLIIVFGGTFAAGIMSFGLDKMMNIGILIKLAYFPKIYDKIEMINIFYEFSIKTRRDGLLALEKEIHRIDSFFTQKLLKMAIDGTDSEMIENIAYSEMKTQSERHISNSFIFQKMGGYAPTMGILGTVMALIITLANAGQDPTTLIRNIATAFIATLWGVFSANVFWLPINEKLKQCHLEEKNMMELSLEGILGLLSGEIPSILKLRLTSLLPQKDQRKITEG